MSDQSPEAPGTEARPFTGFVQEQRRGALHHELSEGLAELVAAVVEHRRAGTLSLTISVKPAGDDQQVYISDSVKVKKPELAKNASLFFATEEGRITRDPPRQTVLPLSGVTSIEDRKAAGE
jgi:hypothetical protein